ncbi:hypothetical protein [Streptomyces sp. NPDC001568]|uniref:hypothetical protein n=1 Tax=Streptomyces sp. NPDC001568 TaxID=3364588 RepID=UPI00369EB23C
MRSEAGKQAKDMNREQQLARTFVELADTLTPGFDPLVLFDVLVTRCVDLLDVDAGGAMMADARGGLRIMAASGEEAVLLELLQLQSGTGPSRHGRSRRPPRRPALPPRGPPFARIAPPDQWLAEPAPEDDVVLLAVSTPAVAQPRRRGNGSGDRGSG